MPVAAVVGVAVAVVPGVAVGDGVDVGISEGMDSPGLVRSPLVDGALIVGIETLIFESTFRFISSEPVSVLGISISAVGMAGSSRVFSERSTVKSGGFWKNFSTS